MARERLPEAFAETARAVCEPLAERIAAQVGKPGFTVGICGTQASGKSTLTAVVKRLLEARGLTVAALSLDDLYLTRAERARLAAEVHPLFATRGPPGTHDVALGERTLDALRGRGEVALP
ncbi:MAG TPA: kinase, partial [Phenylobacterium sp.]|nr:kinase [Phenylobacterium sp.]